MDIEKAIVCLKADKEYLTDMKICDGEEIDIAIKALENQKTMECLSEKAAEEIENLYGRYTDLTENIREFIVKRHLGDPCIQSEVEERHDKERV